MTAGRPPLTSHAGKGHKAFRIRAPTACEPRAPFASLPRRRAFPCPEPVNPWNVEPQTRGTVLPMGPVDGAGPAAPRDPASSTSDIVRTIIILLEVAVTADRQTALAVFDFSRLAARRTIPHRRGRGKGPCHGGTAGVAVRRHGAARRRVRQADIAGPERARFLMVAEHDPRCCPVRLGRGQTVVPEPTTTCARSPTASSTRTYPHCWAAVQQHPGFAREGRVQA